jgi:hypothetical protein
MADLDQLRALDAQIRYAEKRAVQRLAEHLRDAVRDLPSESRLALKFVRYADEFELWATGRDMAPSAWLTLHSLDKQLDELDDDGEED